MVVAMVLLALLPALVLPIHDAYQPVRAIGVAVAAVLLVAASERSLVGLAGTAALALGAAYVGLAALASTLGGLPSGVFGVSGRYQGLLSLTVLAAVGLSGLLAGRQVPRGSIKGAVFAGPAVVTVMLIQPFLGAEPVAFLGNRVIAGAWLAVVAAVLFASALVTSGRTRRLLASSAAISAIGVGLTGSRGAWLALLVGIIVIALVMRVARWQVAAVVSAVAVAALLAGVVFGGQESLSKLSLGSLSTGSAASRMWIWQDTAKLVSDNAVIGIGPGRFLYEYPAYESVGHVVTEGADKRADQAHSLPLHTAAETGLPAAFVAVSLSLLAFGCGVGAARRRDGVALVALAGFSAYLAQALFGVAAVEVDALGWVLGGLLIARWTAFEVKTAKGRLDGRANHRLAGVARAGVAALAAVGVIASLVYITGDHAYTRSVDAFASGDMPVAHSAAQLAVERTPVIDIFRVALSDAASYGGGDPDEAISVLEAGLELEPMSFDLALARARMLAFTDAPVDVVADAYEAALALYPQAVSIRPEVAQAYLAAGRTIEALDTGTPTTSTGRSP